MTDWSFDAWPSVDPNWHGTERRGDRTEYHVDLGCGRVKKGRIGVDRYPASGVNVVMDLDLGRVAAISPEPGKDAVYEKPYGNGYRYYWPNRPSRDAGQVSPLPWLDYPTIADFGTGASAWGQRTARSEAYTISVGLPFPDNSIESIVSHHALEHIGEGFMPLVDDIYRVLKPGGIFQAITPLFPSTSAVSDADHCRFFMEDTWEAFCGTPGDTPQNCWLASFSVPYTRARFKLIDKYMTPRVEPENHWTQDDAREIRVTLKAMK